MPRPMTGFDQWDVLVAPFPFVDAPVRKPRPVLVLSSSDFNRTHAHLVACMITTGARSSWPTDRQIEDLDAAGLAHASVVRWKVFTLPAAMVARRIGALTAADRSAMAAVCASVLGQG